MAGTCWRAAALSAVSMLSACTSDDVPAASAGSETAAASGTSESSTSASSTSGPGTETAGETGELPELIERWVEVTLDGAPVEAAIVVQGGTGELRYTDADGRVRTTIDATIPGDIAVIASHPEARSRAALLYPSNLYDDSDILIELTRFELGDNPEYVFNEPGVPGIGGTTLECGHCHRQLKADWFDSPHRTSASNVAVHDVYAGAAAAFADQASCEAAGGQWWQGREPGTGAATMRCYLGAGTLPDLNEGCGEQAACDDLAASFGACADCHAPAIDGQLGGRDLLDASGAAYDDGVHCDLCHKVESVELDAPAGVGGRLRVLRPPEPASSPGVGPWRPLSFGPYADVPNPRMGAAAREHFLHAEFCAGCHQLDQAALVPGTALDPGRWPSARLPVHSTYQEWLGGPFAEVAPCSSCHMPADPDAGNGADLTAEDIPLQGVAFGWWRPPGAVREHSWVGPRTPSSNMLALAAAVFIDKSVDAGVLTASVRVRNVGAGHAIPTGEPLRALILFVAARCGDAPLDAIGGDAIPEFGGWLDRKPSPEDWSVWPGAAVGDVVRVVVDSGWHDYEGFGPFGDGSFAPAQKGLPRLELVGQATVTAVNGDVVEFDAPLPPGDLAFRGRPTPFDDGAATSARAVAGAPGFAFARVLADAEGQTMVPHHRAVDVVADNRILPQQQWTSSHRFASPCEDPVVDALLVHRPYPVALAAERGWGNPQQIMVELSQ